MEDCRNSLNFLGKIMPKLLQTSESVNSVMGVPTPKSLNAYHLPACLLRTPATNTALPKGFLRSQELTPLLLGRPEGPGNYCS